MLIWEHVGFVVVVVVVVEIGSVDVGFGLVHVVD